MTRRGMVLTELIVAGALVGTMLLVCLQLLAAALAQRQVTDQRQFALLELSNVMEQVTARPWAELTTAGLSQERPSPSVDSQLPGAELKIEVSTSADQPEAKRITAAIRWQGRNGQPLAPVTLTTWRYKITD